ncbi:leucine carboxyl methyltransferase [Phlyctema vagabunda]|uniref:tRNA wybutosine-synthesizing protein 4 n=1 Tax=Phlyctema vagabunda TaxID=108571 RepID=A0ABR4PF41_9HELO
MDKTNEASSPAKLASKVKHQPRAKLKAKSQIQDDSIMGTNNSSIASKRSVERLYFPNEPHYLRYFVKKFQRRAPLINRGYWIRMKAVDQVVQKFLEASSSKPTVVINLGCGYDPLPWQCFTRYPSICKDVKFIDIDYTDLILRKRKTVQRTPELNSMLTNLEFPSNGNVMLQSDQYIQLGCDLREIGILDRVVGSVVDVNECRILFTAEVSITYMNVEAADALVQWAGSLPEAQFCLLEQLLPDGIGHPFAKTMMAHFDKLVTPLGSVQKYPTLSDQENRFQGLGWSDTSAQNLWELWSSSDFMSPSERLELDLVEPFDEWEEFALFGCHYILLVANNSRQSFAATQKRPHQNATSQSTVLLSANIDFEEYPKTYGRRRFATAFELRGSEKETCSVGNFAGMGLTTRLNNFDVYSKSPTEIPPPHIFHSQYGPSSRMCHSMTDLGNDGALLVGGRTSPDTALVDCWVYHKWLNTWERVDDLPEPRYRHAAVSLGNGTVLISTARKNSRTVLDDYLIWSRPYGWVRCERTSKQEPCATFGVTFARFPWLDSGCSGLIGGGIDKHGLLSQELWIWTVEKPSSKNPVISFAPFIPHEASFETRTSLLARFGASIVLHDKKIVLVGGIIKDHLLTTHQEICIVDQDMQLGHLRTTDSSFTSRPLLVGVSTVSCGKKLHILGGSAVCFSFGTFWNEGCYTIGIGVNEQDSVREEPDKRETSRSSFNPGDRIPQELQYQHTVEALKVSQTVSSSPHTEFRSSSIHKVPRAHLDSAAAFTRILADGKPVILEGLNIGPCTTNWTTSYLKETIGKDREVIVHVASDKQMNFTSKNFIYTTQTFEEFINQIDHGARLYLRSLSASKPSEVPTTLANDFPEIAQDFQLPPELDFVAENAHSSPLRISGPVAMWLHYDVMANILCQIQGTKHLILFPPTDVKYLEFDAGASSSGINIFEKIKGTSLACTHPHEVFLQPGDVLFIPSMWLHTASPISGYSIAVNVFFRDLQAGYAAGKDLYGNRDLQVYEKGRQDIARIARSFEYLPTEVRGFYLQRLVDEFQQKTG